MQRTLLMHVLLCQKRTWTEERVTKEKRRSKPDVLLERSLYYVCGMERQLEGR